MLLGLLMAEHPDALRADLQQYYGICLDSAMAGGYRAAHIAALISELPQDSRCRIAIDPENRWTLEPALIGLLINVLGAVFGGRDTGPLVKLPGWQDEQQTITGVALSVDDLMAELSKPRTASPE